MPSDSSLLGWQGLVEDSFARVVERESLKKYEVNIYSTAFSADYKTQIVSISSNGFFMSCDCQGNSSLKSCIHTRAADKAIETWSNDGKYMRRLDNGRLVKRTRELLTYRTEVQRASGLSYKVIEEEEDKEYFVVVTSTTWTQPAFTVRKQVNNLGISFTCDCQTPDCSHIAAVEEAHEKWESDGKIFPSEFSSKKKRGKSSVSITFDDFKKFDGEFTRLQEKINNSIKEVILKQFASGGIVPNDPVIEIEPPYLSIRKRQLVYVDDKGDFSPSPTPTNGPESQKPDPKPPEEPPKPKSRFENFEI